MSNQELLDEYRQDMLEEQRREEAYEIKMRNDSDFFYDALMDKFYERVSELGIDLDNFCIRYGRENEADKWFQILVEK